MVQPDRQGKQPRKNRFYLQQIITYRTPNFNYLLKKPLRQIKKRNTLPCIPFDLVTPMGLVLKYVNGFSSQIRKRNTLGAYSLMVTPMGLEPMLSA